MTANAVFGTPILTTDADDESRDNMQLRFPLLGLHAVARILPPTKQREAAAVAVEAANRQAFAQQQASDNGAERA